MTRDANDTAREAGADGLRKVWDVANDLDVSALGELHRVAEMAPKSVDTGAATEKRRRGTQSEGKLTCGRRGHPTAELGGPPPRFRLVPFEDLVVGTGPRYLVKGLIPLTGLVLIWGPPKCGKSFVTFDLMMHVALDWKYRGLAVQSGPVVYLALEGAEGFMARAEAFRRHHEIKGTVPFYLIATPVNLVADHSALVDCIRDQFGGARPVAIVVDTLNRSLPGSESRDEDMAAYVHAADAIRDAFRCVVVIVHHSGIVAGRPRGHTSLTGAADAQIKVERGVSRNILMSLEWMKDGPEGVANASRLESVDVGTNSDNDPITSCVVVPVKGMSDKVAAKAKQTKAARIALRALEEAIAAAGESAPASEHIPAGTRVTTVDRWRDTAYRLGISDSDKPRARQAAFQRASKALEAAGDIGRSGHLVWLTGEANKRTVL